MSKLTVHAKFSKFKVEYHANENPLKNSEKIAYVGQRFNVSNNQNKKHYNTSLKKMQLRF